jgi:electron transport complex protein RnfA
MNILALTIGAILVNNIILVQFLGICPFLGVSSKLKTSVGMGMAVMFVMTLATLATFLIQEYILGEALKFLRTVAFILVIASLVQMVEIILKKVSPVLYASLGVFLPLITTNCAILGVALLVVQRDYSLVEGLIFSVSSAIGFTLAISIFAGIRERLETADIPKAFKGAPISLVTAGLLALAFMGFSGIVK